MSRLGKIAIILLIPTLSFGQGGICKFNGTLGWADDNHGVFFVDNSTGWVVGNLGYIRKSSDGGNRWTLQTTSGISNAWNAYFINTNTGWSVGSWISPFSETFAKTTNGGTSWTIQYVSFNVTPLYSVWLKSDVLTAFCGGDVNIEKTTDSGTNWTTQLIHGTWHLWPNWLGVAFSSDASTGYFVGQAGEVAKTTNTGVNWTILREGAAGQCAFHSVSFPVDMTIGYAVANNLEANDGPSDNNKIFKTADGGATWSVQYNSSTVDLYGVSFPASQSVTGWAVGNGGTILKTTNGGTSWDVQTTKTTATLYGVQFPVDVNTGYAVGSGGMVLRTTDGGATWNIGDAGVSAK